MNLVTSLKNTLSKKSEPAPPKPSPTEIATAALEAVNLLDEREGWEGYFLQAGLIADGKPEEVNHHYLALYMRNIKKTPADLATDVALIKQWRIYNDAHWGFSATKKALNQAADAAHANWKKAKEAVPETYQQMRTAAHVVVAHGAQARERLAFYGEHEQLLKHSGEIHDLDV